MMNIKEDTIIRTIIMTLALINQVLTLFGLNPLPFSQDRVYEVLTALFTVVTSVWGFWKNNSFTKKAIKADEYLMALQEET